VIEAACKRKYKSKQQLTAKKYEKKWIFVSTCSSKITVKLLRGSEAVNNLSNIYAYITYCIFSSVLLYLSNTFGFSFLSYMLVLFPLFAICICRAEVTTSMDDVVEVIVNDLTNIKHQKINMFSLILKLVIIF
jgi:hypothetical protein